MSRGLPLRYGQTVEFNIENQIISCLMTLVSNKGFFQFSWYKLFPAHAVYLFASGPSVAIAVS